MLTEDLFLPCPGQIQMYFLKKSLCLAAVFKLLTTGLDTCLTAKLTNLNKGKDPTTILKRKSSYAYHIRYVCNDQMLNGRKKGEWNQK